MPIYFPGASSLIPANAKQVIEDFRYSSSALYNHWRVQTSGGGAALNIVTPDRNHWSLLQLTSAAAPSFFCINRGLGQWAVPNGFWQVNFNVQLPALSTGAQSFIVRAGLGDQALADFNNGVYFEYTDSQFNGAWACCVASGGVRTKVSGVAIAAPGFVSLKAYGFGPGTAIFNINGNIVAGISSNFPLQTVALGLILQINKTNGAGGGVVATDYAGLFYVPTR